MACHVIYRDTIAAAAAAVAAEAAVGTGGGGVQGAHMCAYINVCACVWPLRRYRSINGHLAPLSTSVQCHLVPLPTSVQGYLVPLSRSVQRRRAPLSRSVQRHLVPCALVTLCTTVPSALANLCAVPPSTLVTLCAVSSSAKSPFMQCLKLWVAVNRACNRSLCKPSTRVTCPGGTARTHMHLRSKECFEAHGTPEWKEKKKTECRQQGNSGGSVTCLVWPEYFLIISSSPETSAWRSNPTKIDQPGDLLCVSSQR